MPRGGVAYSRKYRDLQREQEKDKKAAAMEIQKTIQRLANETERRRREALEKKRRERERDDRERARILEARRAKLEAAAPPWRLGTSTTTLSGQRPPPRPHMPTCNSSSRSLSRCSNRPQSRSQSSIPTRHPTRASKIHSAPPKVLCSAPTLGHDKERRNDDSFLQDHPACTTYTENTCGLGRTRRPSSGRSHLSYVTAHNGRSVRVVKGYSVELLDGDNDWTSASASVQSRSKSSLKSPVMSRASSGNKSLYDELEALHTADLAPSPMPNYPPPPEKSQSSPIPEPARRILPNIVDLSPSADPSFGGIENLEQLLHTDCRKSEKWTQSNQLSNAADLQVRCVSRPQSARFDKLGGSAPNLDVERVRGISSVAERSRSSSELDDKVSTSRRTSQAGPDSTTQSQLKGEQQPGARQSATPPTSVQRSSLAMSRPGSAGRPGSAKTITFADKPVILGTSSHSSFFDEIEGEPKDEDHHIESDSDSEPPAFVTPATHRTKDESGSIDTVTNTTRDNLTGSAVDIARTGSRHVPQTPPKSHSSPSITQTQSESVRSPLSRSLNSINPSHPTRINPASEIRLATRELVPKDLLPLPVTKRPRSAPSKRDNSALPPIHGNTTDVLPSRIPRWRSAPVISDRCKERIKLPPIQKKVVTTRPGRGQRESLEIFLYAEELSKRSDMSVKLISDELDRIQMYRRMDSAEDVNVVQQKRVQSSAMSRRDILSFNSSLPPDQQGFGRNLEGKKGDTGVGVRRKNEGYIYRHPTSGPLPLVAEETQLVKSIENLDRLLSAKMGKLGFCGR
ncbi:uncharacterized protein SPPG_02575 [Spizellomyces punctatus DAOM BR117]|uniref:Uncharacterized protein n=1 Tax=Spizellomyces punctatus (strain DAOM BR117) TaxID=645134 RepID=A0A0L0HLW1_SPIPD|nr:uncharacterized protein SPPG_02575 [Spizellomyces punctatus DAOM BR117]KND02072.1 hypothetical protein SPPG_02575 [Spizellomyces punctatus DAOM BR117]|eukprot:XP_016610111.1 hypothetical protein SPPG_02575 [Spizellomyces punctatus DAOM BR117]